MLSIFNLNLCTSAKICIITYLLIGRVISNIVSTITKNAEWQ